MTKTLTSKRSPDIRLTEHNRRIMKNNKKHIYLQSLVLIPLLATTMSVGGSVPVTDTTNTLIFNLPSIVSASKELTPEEKERKLIAAKIDKYFADRNMPLEGYGSKFVLEAVKNGIDPTLLAAISVRESTGGIHACKKADFSVFGWGGCKISFESIDSAIEIVSAHLGGNNERTDHWYDNKTTYQILRTYNTVIKRYPEQVIDIMKNISETQVEDGKQLALNS